MAKSLGGLRGLAFTNSFNGPYCARLLAELGMEMIKIEPPTGDIVIRAAGPHYDKKNHLNWSFGVINANHKGVTVKLGNPKGNELFTRLVKTADCLIDNYSPGVLSKLGFPWEKLHEINPGLVYGTTCGFGYTGPYRDYPAYDFLAQAYSGILDITGAADGPPMKTGPAITDFGAGVHLAVGILAALFHRARTGRGQWVDMAQMDVGVCFSTMEFLNYYMITGKYTPVMTRQGNRHPLIAPYNTYMAKDGWVVIATANDAQWSRLCQMMGKPELANDPRFKTNVNRRMENCDELDRSVGDWVKTKTREEVLAAGRANDVPVAKVSTVLDLFEDPQVKARNMLPEVEFEGWGKKKAIGSVFKMSETPGSVDWGTIRIGQHNEEIYTKLGYSKAELEELKKEGVI